MTGPAKFLFLPLAALAPVLAVAADVPGGNGPAPAPRSVAFPSPDGGQVSADLYGDGDRAVVLAHGMVFDKESWRPLAARLAHEGYRVLAIDFRGYGASRAGDRPQDLSLDILGAVVFLEAQGAASVSVVGASMGGGAAARAAAAGDSIGIDRLILLSPVPVDHPERIRARSVLYVASRDERLFPRVREQYGKAPGPKRLEILDGDAHAQNIFATAEGPHLTEVIVGFLAGDAGP